MTRKFCRYVTCINTYVIAMGSHKIMEIEISLACVFRSLFKAHTGNLLEILFEVCSSLVAVFCQFLFQAYICVAGVFQ